MNTQKFLDFYRSHGMRRVSELPTPEPVLVKRLPQGSVIHYLGDSENPQLDISDPLMLGYNDRVRYHNATAYRGAYSGGTRQVVNMNPIVSNFDRRNRGFKNLREITDAKGLPDKTLLVVNYGYLDDLYRYPENPLSHFQRIDNKLRTTVEVIKAIQEGAPRQHYLVLDVPTQLFPKTILDQRSVGEPVRLSKIFKTMGSQLLRQFWLYIDPTTTKESIFSTLSDDQKKCLNFLFKSFDGKFVVLNLGYLHSWITGSENLTTIKSLSTKTPRDIQKYFLRSLMVMQNINLSGISEQEQEKAQAEQAKKLEERDKTSENAEFDAEEGSREDERFHQDADLEQAPSVDASTDSQAGGTPKHVARTGKENTRPLPDEIPELEIDELSIDKDLEALEKIYAKQLSGLTEKSVPVADAAITDVIPEEGYTSEIAASKESIVTRLFTTHTPEESLSAKLNKLADEGRITAPELRKKMELIQRAAQNPDPYGSNLTIAQAKIIKPEELALTPEEKVLVVPTAVLDKSMAFATHTVRAEKYNTKLLQKDILSCVQGIQKGGVIVKNHTVDTRHSVLGSFDIHTLEITPLTGQPSLIRAKIPHVKADGTFEARAVKYVMRQQFADLPIRKIGANRVGLSSYYGKTFVDRATKKANSSLEFVLSCLTKATISPTEWLRDVVPGNVFDNYFEAPYFYGGIGENFRSFKAGNYTFDFNSKGFRSTLDKALVEGMEKNGSRIVGWSLEGRKTLVMIDKDDNFHAVWKDGSEFIGDIYKLLQLDKRNVPVDFAEVKVFSKSIPVGIFLGQTVGFRAVVKMLGAKHRLVEGKQHKNMEDWEYAVQFRDVAYIFDRREAVNTLVLAGYREFEKETKLYDAELFDSRDVYIRLLETKGLSSIYVSEMENLQEMFVDPITERILKEMKEPTNFNALLVRSCELLKTYYYPDSQDASYQRVRGYDRFAGLFYSELVTSVKAFKNKNRTGRAKVDISPFQVWSTITRDATVKQAEDINPIQALKISEEAVTYAGAGGRSRESMNRASRAYVKSNLGTLSADSVDSSDVGINAFLSANPAFDSVDGITGKKTVLNATNMLSTASLLAPFSVNDDAKRRSFIGIQQGHTIATEGYEPPMVRTGYESVIGLRTSPIFAKAARQEGEVIDVTDTGIMVKYKDGTSEGYPLGTVYGKAEGSVYPHPLKTDLVKGQKFKTGTYITYNTNFFVPDPILPGGVVYKGSLMARVSLMEIPQTHEDSSSISPKLSARLMTTTTKVKTLIVDFKENIFDVVKIGQKVRPEDNLLVIENAITSMDNSFNDHSLEILSDRSKNAPKAKYVGYISGVEVLYHGDLSDMTSSLKTLAQKSDRLKAEEAKSRGIPYANGYVDGEYAVDGVPLAVNKAVITIRINVPDDVSVGDKVVYGSQLKSVVGEVMPFITRTETGEEVDAKMGAKSFANRIVESFINIGVRSSTLHAAGKKAVEVYRG